jgi:hypothetical protein
MKIETIQVFLNCLSFLAGIISVVAIWYRGKVEKAARDIRQIRESR